MKIFVRLRKRRKEEFQFFMHDFVDACVEHGFETKPDVMPSYRWHLRAVCRDILWLGYRLIGKLMPGILRRKHALLVTANGNTIRDSVFPYYGCCEIVPMLWDVWPNSWGTMLEMLRELGVKTVLVSSRQVAEMINRETQVKAFWIPEGIKAKLYHRGLPLAQREYDVYEMGRRYEKYHMVLQDMKNEGAINQLLTSNLTKDGTLSRAMSVSIDDFYDNISRYKVMICFPQCDTNPRRAGDIETLTQRYWEAMLSGCLMVGRAPKELVDLIGYNPVVDVDWSDAAGQMKSILGHIADYQPLVDRNLQVANEYADWSKRMPLIIKILEGAGYKV